MRDESSLKILQIAKDDFNDLEKFLKRNGLLDDKNLWFAGFDDRRRGDQNAIAANLLYGNKKLILVSICNKEIFYCPNTRDGLQVSSLGMCGERVSLVIRHSLMYPSVDLNVPEKDRYLSIKVTKNKQVLKEFRQTLKEN